MREKTQIKEKKLNNCVCSLFEIVYLHIPKTPKPIQIPLRLVSDLSVLLSAKMEGNR